MPDDCTNTAQSAQQCSGSKKGVQKRLRRLRREKYMFYLYIVP